METYTYLLVNFFTVVICFIYSFHPKIRFDRHFLSFLKSSVMVGVFFIIWDAWFTHLGVWWFNDRYLVGWRILGLPLEELLFFICIPFSCVFTYYCLDKFFKLDWKPKVEFYFTIISVVILLALCFFNMDKIYTWMTFLLTALSLIYLKFFAKVNWIGKASFIYTILLPGFFAVNGVLTGTGLEQAVVNYNTLHFLDIRMLTIPIEDAVYGYILILWNIYFFYHFNRNNSKV